MINLLLLFLVFFFFFCVWVLALKEAIFFCGYFGNAFKAPLRMQPRETQKISILYWSFSFTRKILTSGKLKTGFCEGGRRVGLPAHEMS